MRKETVELGDEIVDKITGFKGIATAIAKCLTGCDRVEIKPMKLDDKGDLPNSYWFDVGQVRIIKKQRVKPESVQEPMQKSNRRVGGPPTSSRGFK